MKLWGGMKSPSGKPNPVAHLTPTIKTIKSAASGLTCGSRGHAPALPGIAVDGLELSHSAVGEKAPHVVGL